MHGWVEMEIIARGLEWGAFVIQMRPVTKECLTIITIKKMELLRFAAHVTLVGKKQGDWKNAFSEVSENILVFILGKQQICNWCCWTVQQVVGMCMWSLRWKDTQNQ